MAARSSSRSLDNPKLQQLYDDAVQSAQESVRNTFKESKLLSKERHINLPSFDMSEFNLGKILGMGEFCIVQYISSIEFVEREVSVSKKFNIFPGGIEDVQKKKQMISNCSKSRRKGEKYVVKYLKDQVKSNPSLFRQGVIDLTTETQILSVTSHPNIIKLQGFNGDALFEPPYFIVLDRLYSTLQDKMEEWSSAQNNRIMKKIVNIRKIHKMKEKLNIAASVASGLAYLHTLRIVHRDLKPDNIGFDHLGVLKIFDFGLANELRREKLVSGGLYNMTGNTGSRRYMAPEVAREEPYNQTVDIYSLGILLWEMLTGKKAFEGFSLESHEILVAQVGERPSLDQSWPDSVIQIIEECWDHDYRMRPNTDSLYLTLKTTSDIL